MSVDEVLMHRTRIGGRDWGGWKMGGKPSVDPPFEAEEAIFVRAATSPAGDPEPEWGDARTVGNLIAQLRTLDPALPVYGAFHAEYQGRQQCFVRGLTLSKERVNGRRIETGNEAIPYSAVIWSAPAEPEPAQVLRHQSTGVTEITDEMVERAGVAIWNTLVGEGVRLTKEDVLNYSDAAHAALVAALSRKG